MVADNDEVRAYNTKLSYNIVVQLIKEKISKDLTPGEAAHVKFAENREEGFCSFLCDNTFNDWERVVSLDIDSYYCIVEIDSWFDIPCAEGLSDEDKNMVKLLAGCFAAKVGILCAWTEKQRHP